MTDFNIGDRVEVTDNEYGDVTYVGCKGEVTKVYSDGFVLVRLDETPANHTYEFGFTEVTKID